jgi:hypothetical protein
LISTEPFLADFGLNSYGQAESTAGNIRFGNVANNGFGESTLIGFTMALILLYPIQK